MKTTKAPRRVRAAAPASLVKVRQILVPMDFSESSKKALRYAVPFAEQFGAQLTLLYVLEPVAVPEVVAALIMENDQAVRAAKGKLDLLCKQEAIGPKLVGKTLVRTGTPFHEITDAARSLKVDLIVIATRGHTGLKHAWLGSTAERVVRHAPCPVLTVREQEHEFV